MGEDRVSGRVDKSGVARLGWSAFVAIVAAAAVNGCGSTSRSEPTEQAREAVTSCANPFTVTECKTFSGSSSSGSSSGGTKPTSVGLDPEAYYKACWCDQVTAEPDGGYPAYVWSTDVTPVPSGLEGCTDGLSFQYTDGSIGSVWACPTPLFLPSSLQGADASVPLCIDAREDKRGFVSPDGSPTCELLMAGARIHSTAVGNALPGYALVMDAIVMSGYSGIKTDGGVDGGCPGGCMYPFDPAPPP
jgi:hypothetical protein